MKQALDTTDFLKEINKLYEERPTVDAHVIERPAFMALRCKEALEQVKDRVRKEAEIGIHGFISSLPLYDFDLREPPTPDRHPDLSDIDSQPFGEFVLSINNMGLQCFIGRPDLPPTGESPEWFKRKSRGLLSDLGMTMIIHRYLDAVGAVGEQRNVEQCNADWILYVLLPGRPAPVFSSDSSSLELSQKIQGLSSKLAFWAIPLMVMTMTTVIPLLFFSARGNLLLRDTINYLERTGETD